MVILHYIPSLQKSMGQTAQFAQMLKDVMGKTIETHIISGAVSRGEFVKRLSEVHPDIVHLHGCWSYRIALAEQWAINRGYPVILSPHGGLSPRIMQTEFWKKRLPQMLLYQVRTVKKVFVMHASSPQELKDIKELGWKKRIALIPYPQTEAENQVLCDSFHNLYKKIIDTNSRNRLNTREREALFTMLNAAISVGHDTPYAPTPLELQHIAQLTSHNWQTIQIYAIDHRIKDIMTKGAAALSLTMPVNITEVPPRYSVKPSFHSGNVTSKEKSAAQHYATSNPTEYDMAQRLYVLYRSLYKKELREGYGSPIAQLCDIAEAIHWGDYNEEILRKILSHLGILLFSSCIMQILSETLHLTIGYMPLDPINARETETIRKKLNNLT